MKKFYTVVVLTAPKGESGEILGMPYYLRDACKACGTGAKIVGRLVTKNIEKVKQDFFLTTDVDYIVSEALNNAFIQHGIKPDLTQVVNREGKDLPFYHFHSGISLPPMLKKSKGIQVDKSDQCQVCKRDAHYDKLIVYKDGRPTIIMAKQYMYKIKDKDLLEGYDIFHTWEYFGGTLLRDKKPQFGRPANIVSERVKEILENFKVKKLRFDEIIIT